MRLFVAICFDSDVLDRFSLAASRLKAASGSGSFTRRENLHLTLAFLGETTRLQPVMDAMNRTQSPPFSLRFRQLGLFSRPEGDLFWMGADPNPLLDRLHQELRRNLAAEGFPPEHRPFRPHVTLGRRVATLPGFQRDAFSGSLPDIQSPVHAITLMESDHRRGVLTYTPRHTTKLEDTP